MRFSVTWVSLVGVLLCGATPAQAIPPLVLIEVRLSAGVAMGGNPGYVVGRVAPFTLGIGAEILLRDHPWTSFYVGPYIEGVDRIGLGAYGGVRVRPLRNGTRLQAGFNALVVPYTLGGVTAGGGYCYAVGKKGAVRLCADLEGVLFFLGSDLPANRVAGQLNLLVGASFHAM